jgi:hypothetical protein
MVKWMNEVFDKARYCLFFAFYFTVFIFIFAALLVRSWYRNWSQASKPIQKTVDEIQPTEITGDSTSVRSAARKDSA